MKQLFVTYLPWMLSCITLYMTFLQGKKNTTSWIVGIMNQVLWLVWMVSAEAWGFAPLNIGLTYLYIRNYCLWKQDSSASEIKQNISKKVIINETS